MTSPSSDMEIEDGELRKTPISKEPSLESLSLSDDEAMDNLEIKPPQARIHKSHRKNKHSSSKRHSESSSEHRKKHHHSRPHRDDRHRHHREKKEERGKGGEASRLRHDTRREDKIKELLHKQEKRRGDQQSRLDKEERRVVKEDRRLDQRHRDQRIRFDKSEQRSSDKEERSRLGDEGRLDREERRFDKEQQRRLERDIRDRLEMRRMEGVECAKEREEREIRRQRLMEAERVKETYKKDMEERRARREQRERSRSRERKLEAEQQENESELERAGLVVMSDASASPVRDVAGDDVTPVGRSNGAPDKRPISPAPRIPSSDSSSSCSRSSQTEDDESSSEEDEDEDEDEDKDRRREDQRRKEETTKSGTPPSVCSLAPYLPAIQGCRSVEEFHCLNRIEEGTYGVVYRARDKRTEQIVALKRLKMEKEKEGFPITSLREINTLLKAQHPNIVTCKEIVVGSNMDKIFIVMDYVEHDLKSLMETMKHKKQAFVPGEVKCLMIQLLRAVAHLHDNWILHRDLKTSNIMLSHKGILRVGDFGLAREYGSPLKNYTPIVVTLWYRAPELLLGVKEYSTPIDMWSVGCIFAELVTMEPLFTGKSELDQLNRIFKALGTPNERIWAGYSKLPAVQRMTFTEFPVSTLRSKLPNLTDHGLAHLNGFLTYNPAERATAEASLMHPYYAEVPLPINPSMFPTWPAKSEPGYHRKKMASPKPPSGGRDYKQLEGDTDEGFHMNQAERTRTLNFGPGFSLKF